jgi:hypothetical protein
LKSVVTAVALVASALLAGCGGGGGASVPSSGGGTIPATGTGAATAPTATTSSATLTVTISPPATTSASATKRTPAYVAPETTELFVDLQGTTNPAYDYTLQLDNSHCRYVQAQLAQTCTFTVNEPPGTDTFSIVAAAANTNGAPSLLGYSSVTTTVALNSANTIGATLLAIYGPGSVMNLAYGKFDLTPGGTAPSYPYLAFSNVDAANTPIAASAYGANATAAQLFNPLTVSEDSSSSHIMLATLYQPGAGQHTADTEGTPAASVSVNALAGFDGIEVIDTLTGWQCLSFNVSYSTPAVTLHDSEIPQIDSFPGSPKTWTVPAAGMTIPLTCVAPAAAPGTNPCVAGAPTSFSIDSRSRV